MTTRDPVRHQDPIVALQQDLAKHRTRIKAALTALPPDAPGRAALVELEGTALAFIADTLTVTWQVRDYLFTQLREVEAGLNGAMDELEEQIGASDETQFTPEDAAKFTYITQAAQRLAELSVGAPGQSKEAKAELDKILKQAAECLTILRDSTLEDDDGAEDEEEGDGAEDDEQDGGDPAGKPS